MGCSTSKDDTAATQSRRAGAGGTDSLGVELGPSNSGPAPGPPSGGAAPISLPTTTGDRERCGSSPRVPVWFEATTSCPVGLVRGTVLVDGVRVEELETLDIVKEEGQLWGLSLTPETMTVNAVSGPAEAANLPIGAVIRTIGDTVISSVPELIAALDGKTSCTVGFVPASSTPDIDPQGQPTRQTLSLRAGLAQPPSDYPQPPPVAPSAADQLFAPKCGCLGASQGHHRRTCTVPRCETPPAIRLCLRLRLRSPPGPASSSSASLPAPLAQVLPRLGKQRKSQKSMKQTPPPQPTCPSGHPLSPCSTRRWVCDTCDDSGTNYSMFCCLCDYDLCGRCFDLKCSGSFSGGVVRATTKHPAPPMKNVPLSVPTQNGFAIPRYWCTDSDSEITSLRSSVFFDSKVEILWRNAPRGVVQGHQFTTVQRVENVSLWQGYCAEARRVAVLKQRVDVTLPGKWQPEQVVGSVVMNTEVGVNEVYLLHGTSRASAEKIAEAGFDPSFSGSGSGALFGQGTYFTDSLEKAMNYSSGCVIVSRVVLGEVAVPPHSSPKNFRRAPPKQPTAGSGSGEYDSVVATSNFTPTLKEFVVYRHTKAYPEYLIYHD